ncbi:hypothetical protein [Niabella hibiscisoli]|nr:hypothetical protein [Niabella hibiscisoli]
MNPGIMTLDCESIIYLRGELDLFGETVAVADEMPFSFAGFWVFI